MREDQSVPGILLVNKSILISNGRVTWHTGRRCGRAIRVAFGLSSVPPGTLRDSNESTMTEGKLSTFLLPSRAEIFTSCNK